MFRMETIVAMLNDVLRRGNFFAAPPTELAWDTAVTETIPWEIFRGRLLDARQTRQHATFTSWHVFWVEAGQPSGEPLLSVKWDTQRQEIHIVRGLECYVWEGYQAEDNVYLSREVTKWVRELAGTVELNRCADMAAVRDELAGRLFQAVVGLSRLPLTSPESPLPGFSLGQFSYFFHPAAGGEASSAPYHSSRDLLERGLIPELPWTETSRLVELALRATRQDDISHLTEVFARRWHEVGYSFDAIPRLLRTILKEVALSPYADFVPNLLRFTQALVGQRHLPVGEQIDFLGHALRQLGRHLTAYDLHLFHHRGANYPDALLLDAALKEYLRLCDEQPACFLDQDGDSAGDIQKKRLRRRGLRQGWLLRCLYEGLPVPDAPTSPGENTRVLPPPHVRVPDAQILNPGKRRKKLYAADPLKNYAGGHALEVLRASVADLQQPLELRELGMAVFIDRPLGRAKAPGEPDQTLLFSHEGFSRTIARQRLEFLKHRLVPGDDLPWADYRAALASLPVPGLPTNRFRSEAGRVVSLADANRLTDDFLLLRTTPGVVRDFLTLYPLDEIDQLFRQGLLHENRVLIVPDPAFAARDAVQLTMYDADLRPRLQLAADLSRGYISCGGREFPAAGLRVLHHWEET